MLDGLNITKMNWELVKNSNKTEETNQKWFQQSFHIVQ